MLNSIHSKYTYGRRVEVLSDHIAGLINKGSNILDIGCGDGQISEQISRRVSGSSIHGIDVMERSISKVSVSRYDGGNIPFDDNAFDVCTFVDVLHHTDDAKQVLREAGRVAKKNVIIKDHISNNILDEVTLRFMDYVGNKRHGVSLPYNYFSDGVWQEYFRSLGWEVEAWRSDLNIYPSWCSWAFDRNLHFVASLKVCE